ncbi:MAG: major capsid protein [Planctomycetota bacterium]
MEGLVGNVQVDSLFKGQAFGSVAKRLLANEMRTDCLRTNATLRHEEWMQLDQTVVQAATQRLRTVRRLTGRGLTFNIAGDGLATTVLAYEKISDMGTAQISMDGVTPGPKDRPLYTIGYLPLPIIHCDFSFNARVLAASRKLGVPLDTSAAAAAARKVAEKIEEMTLIGASAYEFGGGVIYGMFDSNFTARNTGSLTANWDDSAADPLADVIGMKQKLIDAYHYGPYGVWIPTNFETALDSDFKAASDKSVRQRLSEVEGVEFVEVADKLTADNVGMASLTEDVIRMVVGMDVQTVEWDDEGGLVTNYKVMAIIVPQVRTDYAGRCGIVHYT